MQQPHLTVEQRQLALRLKARGWTLRKIGSLGVEPVATSHAAKGHGRCGLQRQGNEVTLLDAIREGINLPRLVGYL